MTTSGEPQQPPPQQPRPAVVADSPRRGPSVVVVPVAGAAVLVAVGASSGSAVVTAVVCVVLGVLVTALARALHQAHRARAAALQVAADLAAALESTREDAVHDEATGLLNRRGLLLVGRQILESARRSGGGMHCCVVELGGAGAPGHAAREDGGAHRSVERVAAARVRLAAALRAATRSADVVGHDGTGRFVVLGPGQGLHAQELERRLRAGLVDARPAGSGGQVATAERIGLDVGAALLAPWDDGDVPDLLRRAEQALAQRRALRRSAPPGAWDRRRTDA